MARIDIVRPQGGDLRSLAAAAARTLLIGATASRTEVVPTTRREEQRRRGPEPGRGGGPSQGRPGRLLLGQPVEVDLDGGDEPLHQVLEVEGGQRLHRDDVAQHDKAGQLRGHQ